MQRFDPRPRFERVLQGLAHEQSGAVLIIMAGVLTVLMGMAAFAVDYGWLYWNGIKIQHGADAAALAGVVFEPDDQTNAFKYANQSASENGYGSGSGATVTAEDASVLGSTLSSEQLRVTISAPVPTFFMKVFGFDSISIKRTSVAEYVLPLPLGSPDNRFGNDPATGYQPNLWGNIHGYYTGRGMGDRYASQCTSWNSGSGCSRNPDSRVTVYDAANPSDAQGGYLYGIEVSAGGTIDVQVFDGEFTRGGGDNILVGDNPQGGGPGPTTVFILYQADTTPLITAGDPVLCTQEFAPRDSLMPSANSNTLFVPDPTIPWWTPQPIDYDTHLKANGFANGVGDLWESVCSVNLSPGLYPLRVLVKDEGQRGLNRFSLRTNSASTRIYGLGDMSLYSNVDGATGDTDFHLAEVDSIHAGKDLVLELWDPGDASGNHSMTVVGPGGMALPCDWTSTSSGFPSGSSANCRIYTSSSRFNDELVTIRIHIPEAYTCTNCWWKIHYDYPGQTSDTTTWEARIEGNPVKLVE